ncbi:MAG TPA: MGMT family protein [Bacillota bacterium]|nr:MGMT family protein [Bacillota bacterium]
MNNFFQRVYEIVARIPPGKVATYGQIAALLGNPRGARTVGWAMQGAPAGLNLPCHRVVNQSGAMAPDYAFGGAEAQRALLLSEGVTFKSNGCINMDHHRWEVKFK